MFSRSPIRSVLLPALILLMIAVMPGTGLAQVDAVDPDPAAQHATQAANPLPSVQLNAGSEEYELPIQLLLLLTVLAIAPALILLMTSFTRLVVIFGLLRTALGTQQSPPTQVVIGLAMFLTFFSMYPVFNIINEQALTPYMEGTIGQKEALAIATTPMKDFMLAHTREKDLMLFMDLANIDSFQSADDVPLHVLVPSFVISELRIAFQIGFMLFLPFVIIDLVVASVLMSLGMMMLPPVMISLPIKLLLFVLTDGWYLIVESVMRGYTL